MSQAEHARVPAAEHGTLQGADRAAGDRPPLAIILTGTDPTRIKGGIAAAIAGHRNALTGCGLFGGLIPTYDAASANGRWLPWLRALPELRRSIRALQRQGKGVVVYGHAGPRLSLLRECLALLWARANGARTMLQLHTPHMDRYMDKAWVRRLLHLAFLPVDQVAVLSPWWQRRLAEGGFPGTVVIPNALSAELEERVRRTLSDGDARPVSGEADGPVTILAMARLTRGKGIHTAIEALARLPERFQLRVAGDGPELRPLKTLASELGVADRTRFLGWISGAEKARQLSEADIFCAPSKADAFSMSMIEAQCHGLPIVTVRSRAIADLVTDGETGFIVDANDAQAVANGVLALAQPSIRRRMGMAAAEWASGALNGRTVGHRIAAAAAALLAGAEI